MNIQTDKTSMATSTATSVDIKRILQMIPHRYPMLMVDRVTEMELDDSAVGIKNVSINEPFFQGHFPSEPVMPGVLIVEAMAQTAAVLVVSRPSARSPKASWSISCRSTACGFAARWCRATASSCMSKKVQSRANVWKFSGKAMVDGKVAAEATFAAMIRDK